LRIEGGIEEDAPGVVDEEERRIDDGKEGINTIHKPHEDDGYDEGSMGDPRAATVSQRRGRSSPPPAYCTASLEYSCPGILDMGSATR